MTIRDNEPSDASLPSPRTSAGAALPGRENGRRAIPAARGGTGGAGQHDQGVVDQALRIVRNRKWVFLQALVIVPMLALLFSVLQTERYSASSTVLFRNADDLLDTQGSRPTIDPSREAATNEELISLPVVAGRAAKALGRSTDAKQVEEAVNVNATGEADLVEIEAGADSPKGAAALANAYGEAYIAFRREADQRRVDNAIRLVRANLDALSPEQRSGRDATDLQDRLQQLQVARSVQTGDAELVQRATPPSSPSSPKLARNLVLALALGALAGFGLAALLERLDRRLRETSELEEVFDLPILTRIPRTRSLTGRESEDGEASLPARDAEVFRTLRANLRYFGVDEPIRSILVASPLAGEGKSTVARNLAITMASMGDNVVLVEADLHKQAALPNGRERVLGLSSLLAGANLDDCLVNVAVPSPGEGSRSRHLTMIPAGASPPNPTELLESTRMRAVLELLESSFDMVILDTPALSMVSDALALVPSVSGVIIVCGLGETTRDAAIDFRKQVALLRGRSLGLVANFAQPAPSGGYYYTQSTASASQ
jgi:capsular exopolysaccharide synthesis family protein